MEYYPRGHQDPETEEIIALLEVFYYARANGEIEHYLPDWEYQRRGGKAPWTDKELEDIIREIDTFFEYELTTRVSSFWVPKYGLSNPPCFWKMPMEAKRSLVQRMDAIFEKYDEISKKKLNQTVVDESFAYDPYIGYTDYSY